MLVLQVDGQDQPKPAAVVELQDSGDEDSDGSEDAADAPEGAANAPEGAAGQSVALSLAQVCHSPTAI